MKVLVVSGFLGAGKTTFINELSKRTNKKFAILENEYGSIGIDGSLLREIVNNEDDIFELNSGCICCSKGGDFAASIITIANTYDPEFLIIEPTGLGMLSKVLTHIKKVEYERIQILAPLTILDGTSFNRYIQEFKNIYTDQILSSNNIILSKMENASIDEKNQLKEQINKINPLANVVLDHYTKMDDTWWNLLLQTLHTGDIIETKEEEKENFDSFSLQNVSMKSPLDMLLLLENMIRFKYGNIIRAKGSLNMDEINLKFDLVDGNYAILFDENKSTSNLVFIGNNIDKNSINNFFIKKKEYNKIKI